MVDREPTADYSKFDKYLEPETTDDIFRRTLFSHTANDRRGDSDSDADNARFEQYAKDTLVSMRMTEKELAKLESKRKKKKKKKKTGFFSRKSKGGERLLDDNLEMRDMDDDEHEHEDNDELFFGPLGKKKYKRQRIWLCRCAIAFIIISVILSICLIAIIVAAFIALMVAGMIIYDKIFRMDASSSSCPMQTAARITPSNYSQPVPCQYLQNGASQMFDEYSVPEGKWEEVKFHTSPESIYHDTLQLDGYLLESDFSKDPFIIMTHGIRVCKELYAVMYPAAILRENGFNVLVFDLRNAGRQQLPDEPYSTFGSREQFDLIGAIDYIQEHFLDERPPNDVKSIGLFGSSMGGSTALLVFMNDRVRSVTNALFLDSIAYDVEATIKHAITSRLNMNSDLIYEFVCMASAFVPHSQGCAPFRFDPREMVIKGELYKNSDKERWIHFDGAESDDVTPPSLNIDVAKADIEQKYGSVDKLHVTYHTVTFGGNANKNDCEDHVQSCLIDREGYRNRLVNFFNKAFSNS